MKFLGTICFLCCIPQNKSKCNKYYSCNSGFNICGSLLAWFLTNRSQFVSMNNMYSYLLRIASRVPQGSLLFIMYMNDLPDAIHWSKALLFAVDTKFFMHIKSAVDQRHLQQGLNNLSSWSTTSRLSFNSSKSTHISIECKTSTS